MVEQTLTYTNKELVIALLMEQFQQMKNKKIYPNYFSIELGTFTKVDEQYYKVTAPVIEPPIYGGMVRIVGRNRVVDDAPAIFKFTDDDLRYLESLGFLVLRNSSGFELHTLIEPQDIEEEDAALLNEDELHSFMLSYGYHSYFCNLDAGNIHQFLLE